MKILLLAGEQSGKLYADEIAKAMPDAEIRGYSDYGFEIADLAVMGIWPVLKKATYFLRVKRTLQKAIDDWRPDCVCTVDYPGMNLRLAAYAKSRGVRTVHVVCPQVWAWKRGRIPKIEAALDKLVCFFPFEPALFKPGFAEFFGHPLVSQFANLQKPSRVKRLVALLPGSRIGEIERILPTMLDAAKKLDAVTLEIPAANPRAKAAISRIVASSPLAASVEILDGGARELLMRADVAAVASGTATLEAALARCPTVLVYRVNAVFEWIARRVITGVRHIGLANIVWEKAHPDATQFPMPELLQKDFSPDALASILSSWLDDPSERSCAVRALDDTCNLLASNADAPAKIASLCRKEFFLSR